MQFMTIIELECIRGVRKGATGVLRPLMAAWQSTIINYIILSGEALLSDENSGKPLDGQGSAPNPAGWAHSAPQTPVAGGEVIASPHQEPTPFSAFHPSVLPPLPQWKILTRLWNVY